MSPTKFPFDFYTEAMSAVEAPSITVDLFFYPIISLFHKLNTNKEEPLEGLISLDGKVTM